MLSAQTFVWVAEQPQHTCTLTMIVELMLGYQKLFNWLLMGVCCAVQFSRRLQDSHAA